VKPVHGRRPDLWWRLLIAAFLALAQGCGDEAADSPSSPPTPAESDAFVKAYEAFATANDQLCATLDRCYDYPTPCTAAHFEENSTSEYDFDPPLVKETCFSELTSKELSLITTALLCSGDRDREVENCYSSCPADTACALKWETLNNTCITIARQPTIDLLRCFAGL
jgi:hypothetical protein